MKLLKEVNNRIDKIYKKLKFFKFCFLLFFIAYISLGLSSLIIIISKIYNTYFFIFLALGFYNIFLFKYAYEILITNGRRNNQ